MPISLMVFTLLAAVAMCAVAGIWIEHAYVAHWHLSIGSLRFSDRLTLWALRAAGIWLIFWLLFPIIAVGGQQQSELSETNAQQILLQTQRMQSVEARVASIEALRLDARLALLEETRDDVRTMSNEVRGIIGGVVVIVVVQILALLNKPRDRGHQ